MDNRYISPTSLDKDKASLVLAMGTLLALPDVRERHRRQLIDTAVWKYTEAAGMTPHPKYNLRYVTDGARNLHVPAHIQHEHVWERSWIITQLIAGVPWTGDRLTAFLAKHAVACTVTQEEHALLGSVNATGWKRYELAGISVWDRQAHAYLRAGEAALSLHAPPQGPHTPRLNSVSTCPN
ncbi:hypothetical protein EV138_4976 [Kribbella voronezhensis]|uniref:Uncharacterized protein n=1 Tax=Kribbella voronezhensis TaxID=2512212 RepID=A0A4R7TGK5_9ACTN|nr:hypothetical protein [Kribbella voronezhensis]TDU91370.1 hypothetical protein EV138_4976 [Kribbella voronezhensis]